MKSWLYKHYHWVIALIMILQMGTYVGLGNNGGLFILPVTKSLGISRSSYSLSVSLQNLCGFLAVLLSGPLVKRFGYRKLVFVSLPLAGLGYIVLSGSNSLAGLCVGAAMLGITSGYSGATGVNRVVNDWFHRHRGIVLGIVSASSGIGGSIFCFVLSDAMKRGSWRHAYLLSAAFMGVLLALNILFVRDTPDKMGLKPYGEGEIPESHRRFVPENSFQGYSFQELSHRPVFFLMLGVLLVSYVGVYLPYSSIVPHLLDRGLSNEKAVELQSSMLLALSVSKIVMGLLMDVIGVRWVTVLCFACGGVSMWLLPQITSASTALTAIILYSFALPLTSITIPLLTIDMFGYHSYIIAMGVFSSIISIGSMLAMPISSLVFDRFGSYAPAFYTGTVVLALMIVMYFVLYRIADRERVRWESARKKA